MNITNNRINLYASYKVTLAGVPNRGELNSINI